MSNGGSFASSYTNNVTPWASSIFTSFFAVNVLYSISNQKELWIGTFLGVDVLIMVLSHIVQRGVYDKVADKYNMRQSILLKILAFLHLTIVFVIFKLIYDLFFFIIGTSILSWYDYVNVLSLALFIMFIILSKLE